MSTVNKNKLLTVEAVQELKTYIDKQDNQNITRTETVVTTGAVPLINRGIISTSRANKWAELGTSDVFYEFNRGDNAAVSFDAGSSLTMTTTSEGCHIDTIYIKTASGTQVTISNGTELVYNKSKYIPLDEGENVLTFAPMDWSRNKSFHITFNTDAQIYSIKAYGDGEAGEYLSYNDHLYTWDESGNATFKADVKSGTGISLNQTKTSLNEVENRVGDLEAYKSGTLSTKLSEIESNISTLDDTVATMNGEKEEDETNPEKGILTLAKEYTDEKIEEVNGSIASQATTTTGLNDRVSDIETYLSSGETDELKDNMNSSLFKRAVDAAGAAVPIKTLSLDGNNLSPDSEGNINLSSQTLSSFASQAKSYIHMVDTAINNEYGGIVSYISVQGSYNSFFKTFDFTGSTKLNSIASSVTQDVILPYYVLDDILPGSVDRGPDSYSGIWWAVPTDDTNQLFGRGTALSHFDSGYSAWRTFDGGNGSWELEVFIGHVRENTIFWHIYGTYT